MQQTRTLRPPGEASTDGLLHDLEGGGSGGSGGAAADGAYGNVYGGYVDAVASLQLDPKKLKEVASSKKGVLHRLLTKFKSKFSSSAKQHKAAASPHKPRSPQRSKPAAAAAQQPQESAGSAGAATARQSPPAAATAAGQQQPHLPPLPPWRQQAAHAGGSGSNAARGSSGAAGMGAGAAAGTGMPRVGGGGSAGGGPLLTPRDASGSTSASATPGGGAAAAAMRRSPRGRPGSGGGSIPGSPGALAARARPVPAASAPRSGPGSSATRQGLSTQMPYAPSSYAAGPAGDMAFSEVLVADGRLPYSLSSAAAGTASSPATALSPGAYDGAGDAPGAPIARHRATYAPDTSPAGGGAAGGMMPYSIGDMQHGSTAVDGGGGGGPRGRRGHPNQTHTAAVDGVVRGPGDGGGGGGPAGGGGDCSAILDEVADLVRQLDEELAAVEAARGKHELRLKLVDSLLDMTLPSPQHQQQHPQQPGTGGGGGGGGSGQSLGGRLGAERGRLVAEQAAMAYRWDLLSYARGEWSKVASIMAGVRVSRHQAGPLQAILFSDTLSRIRDFQKRQQAEQQQQQQHAAARRSPVPQVWGTPGPHSAAFSGSFRGHHRTPRLQQAHPPLHNGASRASRASSARRSAASAAQQRMPSTPGAQLLPPHGNDAPQHQHPQHQHQAQQPALAAQMQLALALPRITEDDSPQRRGWAAEGGGDGGGLYDPSSAPYGGPAPARRPVAGAAAMAQQQRPPTSTRAAAVARSPLHLLPLPPPSSRQQQQPLHHQQHPRAPPPPQQRQRHQHLHGTLMPYTMPYGATAADSLFPPYNLYDQRSPSAASSSSGEMYRSIASLARHAQEHDNTETWAAGAETEGAPARRPQLQDRRQQQQQRQQQQRQQRLKTSMRDEPEDGGDDGGAASDTSDSSAASRASSLESAFIATCLTHARNSLDIRQHQPYPAASPNAHATAAVPPAGQQHLSRADRQLYSSAIHKLRANTTSLAANAGAAAAAGGVTIATQPMNTAAGVAGSPAGSGDDAYERHGSHDDGRAYGSGDVQYGNDDANDEGYFDVRPLTERRRQGTLSRGNAGGGAGGLVRPSAGVSPATNASGPTASSLGSVEDMLAAVAALRGGGDGGEKREGGGGSRR